MYRGQSRDMKTQVKGRRPASVEVRDTACEFPSVLSHRPALGGLILSHFDVIDTELQPNKHHTRLSCHFLIHIGPPCRAPGCRQIVPASITVPPVYPQSVIITIKHSIAVGQGQLEVVDRSLQNQGNQNQRICLVFGSSINQKAWLT